MPRAEQVHWLFATGFLVVGLCLLCEAVVGADVWRRRAWRAYLWPSFAFLMGLFMWPVMVFFTSSTVHMLAHGAWAQALMAAGAAELALVRGKLRSGYWRLTTAAALLVSGEAFLVHEQNGWLFQRSAFLHHAIGWTLVVGAVFAAGRALGPATRGHKLLLRGVSRTAFALVFVVIAVFLFADRDAAPIFGHLSPRAGVPHR